jgi:glucuronosyltransferase
MGNLFHYFIVFLASNFLLLPSSPVHGARILFIAPLSSKSENNMFIPLARELAVRGHSITYVGSTKPNLKMNNLREIAPIEPLDISDFDASSANPIESRRKAKQNPIAWLATYDFSFIYDGCRKVYENAEFQSLYRESFDLLIIKAGLNNCFDGLVTKFGAPFILMSGFPVDGSVSKLVGLRMPSSFVPNPFLEFTDRMSFGERFSNTLFNWLFDLIYTQLMPSDNEAIYRHYLGRDYPSMMEIERNVSLVLSNSHPAVTTVRPLLPVIVEVGGLHCVKAKPLSNV